MTLQIKEKTVELDWVFLGDDDSTSSEPSSPPSPIQLKEDERFDPEFIAELNGSANDAIREVGRKLSEANVIQSSEIVGSIEIRNIHLTHKLTLADFQALINSPWEAKFIRVLQLKEPIEKIDPYFSFIERLQSVAYPILKLVSLYHLQRVGRLTHFRKSAVYLALAPDEVLLRMPVGRFAENYQVVPPVLKARLEAVHRERPQFVKESLKDLETLTECVGQLALIHPIVLNQMADKIPPLAIGLVVDEQLEELDFSRFSNDQIGNLFQGAPEVIRRKIELLSDVQQNEVFSKIPELLQYLPDKSFATLVLSGIESDLIHLIFPRHFDEASKASDRRRFQMIPGVEVGRAMSKFYPHHFEMISDRQILEIDWKTVGVEEFQQAILTGSDDLVRHRMSLMTVDNLIRYAGKPYTRRMYEFLTDEQIQGFGTTDCPPPVFDEIFLGWRLDDEVKRQLLSMIDPMVVLHFLGKVSSSIYNCLPDACYVQMPLSQMDENEIQSVFPLRFSEDKDQRLFGLVPAQEVAGALERLQSWHLKILSDRHIQEIDWTQVDPGIFQKVFLEWSFDAEKILVRMALLPSRAVVHFFGKAGPNIYKYLSDRHIQEIGTVRCPCEVFEDVFLNSSLSNETKLHRTSLLLPETLLHFWGKVDVSLCEYFTDGCYKILPLSTMNETQIDAIFPMSFHGPRKEIQKKRFAMIPAREVALTISRLKTWQIGLVSDRQIQQIKWDSAPPGLFQNVMVFYTNDEKRRGHRVSLIAPETVYLFIGKVVSSFYDYLTDPQLALIGARVISSRDFKEVFYSAHYGLDEQQRRVALVEPATINRFLRVASGRLMGLLTDRQIQELDVDLLRQEQIDCLFPSFALENLEPGSTYELKIDRRGRFHTYELWTEHGHSFSCYTDEEVQQIIDAKKAICLKNITLLGNKMEILRDKLKPEVAALAR